MKETPILQVNELTKRYGATTALEGVSVAFRRGEVHALVGENGAGKSTLSKIIAGAVQPTEGTLTIKGQTVTGLSPMQAKKLGISMVYQEFNLVPELPVYENLFIGKELRNGPVIRRAEMIRRSQEIFETMGVTPVSYTHLDVYKRQALMYALAPWIIGMLSPDRQVVLLGTQVLRIVVFSEPLFGASIVTAGVFRGAGSSLLSSVLNLSLIHIFTPLKANVLRGVIYNLQSVLWYNNGDIILS